MTDKIKIESEVENGRLKTNRETLRLAIKSFEGKRVEITVSKARVRRSNEQNRYWFGVVIPLIQAALLSLGNAMSKESVHEALKYWLSEMRPDLLIDEITVDGETVLPRLKSTTELSTVQFMELVETAQQWAAENLDIQIPSPDEQITPDV